MYCESQLSSELYNQIPVQVPILNIMLNLCLSAQTYKAFLPAMIANNHGHLVSIASSAGLISCNGLAGMDVSDFLIVTFKLSILNIIQFQSFFV